MLRILFTAQCDVCGEMFDQMLTSTTTSQNECAIQAGGLIETTQTEGWFFNSKTRKFWCADCLLGLAGSESMPSVEQIRLPGLKFG